MDNSGSNSCQLIAEGPPLLMVDRIRLADDGKHAVGLKAVSMDEAFFQGHFPGNPIMPGVLQVAAMSQVCGALMRQSEGEDCLPWLVSLKRVKFRRPVVPGDLLVVEGALEARADGQWSFKASTTVDGQKACTAELTLDARSLTAMALPEREWPQPLPEAYRETVADTARIQDLIPHRYPFLLVDRIALMEPPRVVGIKNVTIGEPWLRGMPLQVFPGCLQIEAVAQAACALALSQEVNAGKIGYFMSVDEATFHGLVVPGDQLVMDVTLNQRGRFGIAEAILSTAGEVVVEAAMKFAIVEPQ